MTRVPGPTAWLERATASRGRRAVATLLVATVGFAGAAAITAFAGPGYRVVSSYGPHGDGRTRLVVAVPGGVTGVQLSALRSAPGVDSAQRLFTGEALVAGFGITAGELQGAVPGAAVVPSVTGSVAGNPVTDPAWTSDGYNQSYNGSNADSLTQTRPVAGGEVALGLLGTGLVAETRVTDPAWTYDGYNLSNNGSNADSRTQTRPVAGADVGAPAGWAASTGRGAVIAVLDTGMTDQPDLAGALWTNPAEPCGTADVDADGYAGDCHGWNFYAGNADVTNAAGDASHGTAVAGTVAARAGNGIGLAGVAPDATIMPLVVGSGEDVDIYAAAQAIVYAADHGATVINGSWGGNGGASLLQSAIDYANSKGALVVVAAGNDHGNRDTSPVYPASLHAPNLVVVGATTPSDTMTSFSGYGAHTVDLFAPGDLVFVPWWQGGYVLMSGTSFSSPETAGAAALYRSVYPTDTPARIKARMLNDVTVVPALQGKSVTGGRLSLTALGNTAAGVTYTFSGMTAAPGVVTPTVVVNGSAPAGSYSVQLGLGMEDGGQTYALADQPITVGTATASTGDDGTATFALGQLPALASQVVRPSTTLAAGRYVLTAQVLLDGAPVGRTYAAPLVVSSTPPGTSTPGTTTPGTTPGTTTPGTTTPGTTTPGTTTPGTTTPGTPGPSSGPQPSTGTDPGTSTPGAQPGTSNPGTSTPGAQPGTSTPGTSTPGTSNPGTSTPGTQPGTSTPGTSTPGAQPGAPGPSDPSTGTQPGVPGPSGGTQPGTEPGPGSTPGTAPGVTDPSGSSQPGTSAPDLGGQKNYPGTGTFGLTSISPTRVSTAGGTTVTITGTAIPTGVRVRVGATAAATVLTASGTQVTFTSPVLVAGVYDVSVFAPDGTSAVLTGGLTYIDPAGGTSPGTTAPGTTSPGTTTPGTTTPGTTTPGTTPGTGTPGTSNPPTPNPGTTDPGTTAPGTTSPGTSTPGAGRPPADGTPYSGPHGEHLRYSARFAAIGAGIWGVNCATTCSGLAM